MGIINVVILVFFIMEESWLLTLKCLAIFFTKKLLPFSMYVSKNKYPWPPPKKHSLNMLDDSLSKNSKINPLRVTLTIWQRNISTLCSSRTSGKIHILKGYFFKLWYLVIQKIAKKKSFVLARAQSKAGK